MENGVFFKESLFFIFLLNRCVDSICRWLKRKPFLVRFTEMHCSIAVEMSTNSFKMRLGLILVNSVVRRNCGKFRQNVLTGPQCD